MNEAKKIYLRLYLIQKSPVSKDLIRNLTSLLDRNHKDKYILEIIDILSNPEITRQDKILASPTLIKVEPLPSKRFVGNVMSPEMMKILEIDQRV